MELKLQRGDFGLDMVLVPSSKQHYFTPVWAMSNVVVRWKVYSPVQVQARQTAGQEYSKSRTGALSRADQAQARPRVWLTSIL